MVESKDITAIFKEKKDIAEVVDSTLKSIKKDIIDEDPRLEYLTCKLKQNQEALDHLKEAYSLEAFIVPEIQYYLRDIILNHQNCINTINTKLLDATLDESGGLSRMNGFIKDAEILTPEYESNIKDGIEKVLKLLDVTKYNTEFASVELEDVIQKDFNKIDAEINLSKKLRDDSDISAFFKDENLESKKELLTAWKKKANEFLRVYMGLKNNYLATEDDKINIKQTYFAKRQKFIDDFFENSEKNLETNSKEMRNLPKNLFDLIDVITTLPDTEAAKNYLDEEFIRIFGPDPVKKITYLNEIYKRSKETAFWFANKFHEIKDPRAKKMAVYIQAKYQLEGDFPENGAIHISYANQTKEQYIGLITACYRLGRAPEVIRYSNQYLDEIKPSAEQLKYRLDNLTKKDSIELFGCKKCVLDAKDKSLKKFKAQINSAVDTEQEKKLYERAGQSI